MDFSLSPETLRLFCGNLNLLEEIFLDNEQRHKFFCRFPFDQLTKYTVLQTDCLRLAVRLLHFLSGYEELFTFGLPYKNAIDLVLTNLAIVKSNKQPIKLVLELLQDLLSKNQKHQIDTDNNRILESLLNITAIALKHSVFHAITNILELILSSEWIQDLQNDLISKLFDRLNTYKILPALWIVTKHVLFRAKFLSEVFKNVQTWLLEAHFLDHSQFFNEQSLDCMLDCLATAFLLKIKVVGILPSYSHLTKITSYLVDYSQNCEYRNKCLHLLALLLYDFYHESDATFDKHYPIAEELKGFPLWIEDWPLCQIDLFFSICHLQLMNDDLIWPEADVLRALETTFYNKRYSVKLHILKSMFYLYPIIITRVDQQETQDFLNYFVIFSSTPILHSYNLQQLRWILKSDVARQYKLNTIAHWLNHSDDVNTLATVIGECNAMDCLMQLVCDCDKRDIPKNKLCFVMKKVKNVEMSHDLMALIPKAVNNLAFFGNLMLCEPGVPTNAANGVMICTIMGCIIPRLKDMEVLCCACRFTRKVLIRLKNISHSVTAFCRNVNNIQHLVQITPKVCEETSVEIITLLKIIITLQIRHRITPVKRLQENSVDFLKGSNMKLIKSIEFLRVITRYERSLITLDERTQFTVFNKVWELCDVKELQPVTYEFINEALKKKPFLVIFPSTSAYIEMACFGYFGRENQESLLQIVYNWIASFTLFPLNAFGSIPKEIVASFIKQSCVDELQKRQMLTALKRLIARETSYRP